MIIKKGLFVSLILWVGLTLISVSGLAQASAGSSATPEGQVVCSSCWFEADRNVTPYGNEGDPAIPEWR